MHVSRVGLLTDRRPTLRYSEPVGRTDRSATRYCAWGRIVDETETTNSLDVDEPGESEDAEEVVAEKTHGSDLFGDGSVRG